MNFDDYQVAARRTSQFKYNAFYDGKPEALDWNVLGLTGEAGEVADMVKKFRMHGHKFDRAKFVKELGDVLWYVSECARLVGYDLSAIAMRNLEKLKERYPDGFSTEASVNRSEEAMSNQPVTGSNAKLEEVKATEAKQSFAVGDTVKLKSGTGPVMTISAVNKDETFTWLADGKLQKLRVSEGYVSLVWFAGFTLCRDFLPAILLQKYEKTESSKSFLVSKLREGVGDGEVEISDIKLDRDHG